MSTVQKIGVLIAITGLATTLVLPGRQTAAATGAVFNGLSTWTKAAQGR